MIAACNYGWLVDDVLLLSEYLCVFYKWLEGKTSVFYQCRCYLAVLVRPDSVKL